MTATRCGPKFQTVVSSGVPIPGPVGPRGAIGPQGVQGVAGMNGAGLVVRGTVPTVQDPLVDLPQIGNYPGDGWIAEDTGDIWTWTGTAWINAGLFGGPTGPMGPVGPAGPVGPQGIQGVPGASNPATPTQLGSIIIGSGLAAQADGTTSVHVGPGLTIAGSTSQVEVNPGPGITVSGLGNLTAVQAGSGLAFLADGTLVVPPATISQLGGVIIGPGINIGAGGVISVPYATATMAGIVMAGPGLVAQANGLLTISPGTGLAVVSNNVVLMPASPSTLGGIIVGTGFTIQPSGLLSVSTFWQPNGSAIYYSVGFVGINTMNPAYWLDVLGSIRAQISANSPAFLLTPTSGTVSGAIGSQFGGMSIGTTSSDALVLFTNNLSRLSIASTGNVNVTLALSVGGNFHVTGMAQVGQSAPLVTAGDLSISRNSLPNTGAIYFGATGTPYLYWDGAAFNFQGGAVNMSGSLAVSGNATVNGNLTIPTGNINATQGSITAGTSLNAVSLSIPGTINAASGMVGVGGITPTHTLTTNGNIRIATGCLIFSDGTQLCTAANIPPTPAQAPHAVANNFNTSYPNSHGTTIWVSVTVAIIAAGARIFAFVNAGAGNVVAFELGSDGGIMSGTMFFPVPKGATYYIDTTQSMISAPSTWIEWY